MQDCHAIKQNALNNTTVNCLKFQTSPQKHILVLVLGTCTNITILYKSLGGLLSITCTRPPTFLMHVFE